MTENLFLVSVADAIGRNATTKQVYFYGKSNVGSSFQTAMQAAQVRGGKNAGLLFTYYHSREVSCKIDSAIFDKVWLALNAGTTSATNGTATITRTESVTLTGGSGVLTGSAIASTKVGIITSSGSISNLNAAGSTIYVEGGAATTVTATYDCSGSNIDYVTGYTVTPPSGIELVLTSEVRNSSNVKLYDFQIVIPSFNISGNQQLQLTADGVSQVSIEGTALVTTAASGDYYYIARFIPA